MVVGIQRGKMGVVNEIVTVTGRGNKINGAAATVGLSTSLTDSKGGILTVSVSPRKGVSDKLNISGGRIRGAVCRLVVNGYGVRRYVYGRPVRGLDMSILPSDVSLSTTRVRLVNISGGRCVLQSRIRGVGSGCSFVVVSYPPTLDVLAVGTVAASSSIVIPVRYRCCTLRKLDRLVRAVRLIRSELGPGLRVRNIMFAVCSTEAGLSLRMIRGMGSGLGRGVCGAVVPEGIQLTRTPDCKLPVGLCSPGSGKARDCVLLTRRIVGGKRWMYL